GLSSPSASVARFSRHHHLSSSWLMGTTSMGDAKFLSDREIVEDYVCGLSEADRTKWLGENGILLLHFTLGAYLRNHYRMWDPDNPHGRGFLCDADSRSERIISLIWTRLREGDGRA